jgi:hypothetical protein
MTQQPVWVTHILGKEGDPYARSDRYLRFVFGKCKFLTFCSTFEPPW